MKVSFKVNGSKVSVDVDPSQPLLWVLRDELNLTGTKFGCGKGLCGACTIHLNGQPIRSCSLPVSAVNGQNVTTIEGIEKKGELNPVQEAWIKNRVPQCGYCQSGQIMTAISLIRSKKNLTKQDVDEGMNNLCRCGTYPRILK